MRRRSVVLPMMAVRVIVGAFAVVAANAVAMAQTTASPQETTSAPAISQDVPQQVVDDPLEENIDVIMVTGRQPGPRLWKVSKGEHVLWILGTQSPLPSKMDWDSSNVVAKVAASQQVIQSPSVSFGSDIGFFRGMMLMPSFLKSRKNPDGKTLKEVLSPELYARWSVLRQRYIGKDRGVETMRPLFAAGKLYEQAIEKSGMTSETDIGEIVRKAAKQHDVAIVSPKIEVNVPDPKAALKEFSTQSLDDIECFAKTMARVESDLAAMAERANAWAQGDIETLRNRQAPTQWSACNAALTNSAIARKFGIHDLDVRVEREWMKAVENALTTNASTFSILPMSQLLNTEGYLAKLAAKGYAVEAP